MATTSLYPLSATERLRQEFVGKSIKEVVTPAAVLDISKLKRNCVRMLETVESLKFGWRAHVKTHKTTELTKLQVGEGPAPANIIVSTLIEAENVTPLLLEYKEAGREVNLLYGLPVGPSQVERLAGIAKVLGDGCLSLLLDHPGQLPGIDSISKLSGVIPRVYIKIDMGSHRAGVMPQSEPASQLISSALAAEAAGSCHLFGLYSHAGHSYAGSTRETALDFLRQEFEALLVVAEAIRSSSQGKKLVLSVGATPTTTSVRNLLVEDPTAPEAELKAIAALKATITAIQADECLVEIHAGVYPTLDVQQLATHALPTEGPNAMLQWSDLAFTVIAEVISLYPGRGVDGLTEVLIGSGSLALGREPCKAYSGFGIISPWNGAGIQPNVGPELFEGWQVGRISQEHGTLAWKGEKEKIIPLHMGQKVRIWPNHACITGAGFGWYLIVDSGRDGFEDEIIDVWPRWRGW